MPVLEVLTGDLEGRSYPIDDQTFSIGRQSDNDIVLPKKYISRRHAEILRRRNQYVVRGLSDKNPIFHDNREKPELILQDGEVFEICDVRFRFLVKGVSNVEARSKEASRQKKHRFDADSGRKDDFDDEPAPLSAGQSVGTPADDGWDDSWDDEPGGKEPPKKSVRFDDESSDDTEALAREISAVRQRGGSGKGKPNTRRNSAIKKNSAIGKGSAARTSALDGIESESMEGPREQIVFGADDGEDYDDDEKTGVVNLNASDDDEQTGMLDLMDIDAPIADPFDNKKKVNTKDQDKFFKALSAVGLGAIVVAVLMVLLLDTKDPPVDRVNEEPFQSAIKESSVKEIDFPANDPPDALMRGDGAPTPIQYTAWMTILDDPVARVDWIMPSLKRRAVFLVTGKKEGQTSFKLRYKYKGDTKEFPILISGKSERDKKRASRMQKMAGNSIVEIKSDIRRNLGQGDQLWSERLSRGSSENFARALEHYRLAGEGVEILKKKISTVDSDFFALKDLVQQKIETAENGYKKFYEKQRALYTEYRRSQKNRQKEKRQLEMILEVIYFKDDPEYKRFELFKKNYYK